MTGDTKQKSVLVITICIWPKQKFKLIFMFGSLRKISQKMLMKSSMELLIFVTILLEYLEHNR